MIPGRFFLTYKRGNTLVFAREVEAESDTQAQHVARQAMVADFANRRVRLTNLAEMRPAQASARRAA
ncbi:MAG TPA: hypothetical protein VHY22_10285 [Chthoniobacteraceae bacterium]|jgi:hypothetical protein|nr:hypothetical protein [Chthoniobacteraceae bacterium]